MGPVPGVQRIIILARVDLELFTLPMEINEITGRRDLALGAT